MATEKTKFPTCCDPATETESGKNFLVTGKESNCPEALTGQYPSIPFAENGDAELRTGAVESPITLPALEEREGISVYALVEKRSDGTISAVKPPEGDKYYVQFDETGVMHMIKGDLSDLISKVSKPDATYKIAVDTYLDEKILVIQQSRTQTDPDESFDITFAVSLESLFVIAPNGAVGMMFSASAYVDDYITKVSFENNEDSHSFVRVTVNDTFDQYAGRRYLGEIPKTWNSSPDETDGELRSYESYGHGRTQLRNPIEIRLEGNLADGVHSLASDRDVMSIEVYLIGWIVETSRNIIYS